MNQLIVTIKNGTVNLPKKLGKAWQGAKVLVWPTKGQLIFKKLEKPGKKLSENISILPPLTPGEIQKEINSYRRSK
ncbi:MAG: hypothetical protein AAB729_00550 [Patescibacteria group bacterium]